MKNFLFLLVIYNMFNIFKCNTKSKKQLQQIIPDSKLILQEVHLNKEILLDLKLDTLQKSQKYKIMVHYIGSYAITFDISIICDDIHFIKNIDKKNNINLNDFSEFDFQTNDKKIPTQCGNNYDKNKVLLSLKPKSIAYQFIPEEEIKFNIIVELITNVFNTDIKPLNILFNKGVYKGVILCFIIIPLMVFIFRNKIKLLLKEILDYNTKKLN